TRQCSCTTLQVLKYQKRISGPLLDRIDIHIDVPAVDVKKITADSTDEGEGSQTDRNRVEKARKRQQKRFHGKKIITNSEMSAKDIKTLLKIEQDAKDILREAVTKLSLSARSYHKVIKISQTIADLANSKTIKSSHVLEALQYRPKITGD
ncbi:MAG: ATP-binding protein, partial [Candidatus Levyibacteriota bacterium]